MNNTKQAPILHEDGISYLVPLTRGFFARIDAEDLEKVTRYSWNVSNGYAATTQGWGEYQERIGMHRLVTDCPKGMVPDHINADRLDNRKINLRICTPSENSKRKQKKTPEQKAAEAANKELRQSIGMRIARKVLPEDQMRTNLGFEMAMKIAEELAGYIPVTPHPTPTPEAA
jgi:hypothetical protein